MSKSHSQMAEELADSLTVSASPGTYTLGGFGSGLTYSNTAINGTAYPNVGLSNSAPYTISGSIGSTSQPWFSNSASPKIKLDGEGADIEVNGISLITTLQEIQSRLNLLQPNVALEKEWEELFELGRKYRELEQHIKEKQATWDKLKAMPPPTVD